MTVKRGGLMEDTISRKAAIEIIHELQDSQTFDQTADMAYDLVDWAISEIPSAQQDSKETSPTHKALDTISRQAAIDALTSHIMPHNNEDGTVTIGVLSKSSIKNILNKLPSAQPEIVRCKDCIFHGLCRISPKWAVAPKDDWYCADAERSTDERCD